MRQTTVRHEPNVHRLHDLPANLQRILVDCRVAERIRLIRGRLSRAEANLEMAFLLKGSPPKSGRPARVVDAQPIDSFSSSARVDTTPEGLVSAHAALVGRGDSPGESPGADAPPKIIAIAHTHPAGSTQFSAVDQEWHRDCLDTNFRKDLVVEIPEREPDAGSSRLGPSRIGPTKFQIFYSLIFPASGRFDEASAYLLSRRVGGDREDDRELEIGLDYTECESAERSLEGLRLCLDWRSRWEANIAYEWDNKPATAIDSEMEVER